MNPQETWQQTVVRASRPVRYAATAALIVLALFLIVAAIDGMHNWGQADIYGPDTISVTGEGMATAIPDTATISFGSTATAADVATAESKMATTINAAIDATEADGVSKDDVTTTDYSVNPHYSAPVCMPGVFCPATVTPSASGYDVSETVSVKVTDTTKVATILADLAKANVTNVSGPDFVVGDTQLVMQQARAQAISKAQADAKILASQLGVKLGKVTDFEDNTNGNTIQSPEPKAMGAMEATAVVAPTIPTGSNEYTDDVSITYEIN